MKEKLTIEFTEEEIIFWNLIDLFPPSKKEILQKEIATRRPRQESGMRFNTVLPQDFRQIL